MEMELIRRSLGNESNKSGFNAEWKTWKKLFTKISGSNYDWCISYDLSTCVLPPFPRYPHIDECHRLFRMEWYQCFIVLWANDSSNHRITRYSDLWNGSQDVQILIKASFLLRNHDHSHTFI